MPPEFGTQALWHWAFGLGHPHYLSTSCWQASRAQSPGTQSMYASRVFFSLRCTIWENTSRYMPPPGKAGLVTQGNDVRSHRVVRVARATERLVTATLPGSHYRVSSARPCQEPHADAKTHLGRCASLRVCLQNMFGLVVWRIGIGPKEDGGEKGKVTSSHLYNCGRWWS